MSKDDEYNDIYAWGYRAGWNEETPSRDAINDNRPIVRVVYAHGYRDGAVDARTGREYHPEPTQEV